VARRAIRLADLAEPETVAAKLDELLLHHNTLLAGLGAPTFAKQDLLDRLMALAPKVLPFAEPVWERLDEARRAGRRILFEGAQAVMLDVDHGTYPFVTSSNTVAATAAAGSGMGPSSVGFVLGIAKAYCTRVGSGPFPTELTDATGQLLGDRGAEFGVVTGRRRRCGWFDAALCARRSRSRHPRAGADQAGRAGRAEGAENRRRLPHPWRTLPPHARRAGRSGGSGTGIRDAGGLDRVHPRRALVADLPAQAVKYVRRIEELVEAPVTLLSTSPERDDTILMKDPFEG